jgi:outer membrane protein assembly factor BamB
MSSTPDVEAVDVEVSAPWGGEFDRPPAFEWRVRLPGPRMNAATHAEWSDPVLHGDIVLVGSAAGRALYALSRDDGSVIREFPAENSVESSATAAGDRVWFGDTGGNTYCYDLDDGELVWQHDGNAPILVAPVVVPDGSKVLVTNIDDLAVSLDAVTGELLWQYRSKRDLTRQAELTLYAAPRAEIRDDLAVLGFSSGVVVAVDLETGEERWKRGVGEGRYPDIVADPVTVGTDLYTSGYYRPLVAIDLPSHNVRWRVDAGAAHAVAVDEDAGGQVMLYHPGSDGILRAVVALTGAELWSWNSGSSGALTTPLITDAGLLVASSETSIWLVDPVTGETVWRWHEPWMLQGISADPAIEGRQAMFVTNAGFLYSLIVPRPSPERGPAWP